MAGTKELRLGLVCYGGSSLAIYMHGTTKEIHRLVKASALADAGLGPGKPSEAVYHELLAALGEHPESPRFRAVVDVVAGTSAGGINGIYLAKALAHNVSQDGLRDLWFLRGDMDQLVLGPRKLLGIPLSWKLKVPGLAIRALRRSPLRGDDMSRWLYGALVAMNGAGQEPSSLTSLMPPGHPLDLFVTITDFYGYDRQVPIFRPRFVHDGRHRHALTFSYRNDGPDDFGDNAGLAFAARTTSCFPAVFPPVSLPHFSESVNVGLDELKQRSFRVYELSGAPPEQTYFVDGGVLDNKPFDWAIGAILNARPAASEVDRRLLYLEPDPGEVALQRAHEDPDTLEAALGALSTIPRSEPILDDLITVVAHNERVRQIRDIIEQSFDRVEALTRETVGVDDLATITTLGPDRWPWSDWNRAVRDRAKAEAGIAYATYVRLKISRVVDHFATTICTICNYPEESNHAPWCEPPSAPGPSCEGSSRKGPAPRSCRRNPRPRSCAASTSATRRGACGS